MLTRPQLDDHAVWKQRFRTPVIAGMLIAPANPMRNLAEATAKESPVLSR